MAHTGKTPPSRLVLGGPFQFSRLIILGIIFSCLFLSLIIRLYRLQVLEGSDYQAQYISNIQKKQRIPGTRGRIFDRNGVLLAENRLSYDLTLEDVNSYRTKTERQGTLNGIANRLLDLTGDDGTLNTVLPIKINDNGDFVFTLEGVRLNRFRADLMGKAYIEDLTEKEASMTASDVVDYLCAEDMFMIAQDNTALYTKDQQNQYNIPDQLSRARLLCILNIRYGLSLNSYRKYMAFTVAWDVSETTMTAVLENQSTLAGAKIQQSSLRYYYGGESMSGILGYTGPISAEELEQYKDSDIYGSRSMIGKSGIEKSMEEWLRGRDGEEQFYTDVVGHKKTGSEITAAAKTGNDVYLTIDLELQDAVYRMLEQQIAGILLSNMVNTKKADMPEAREAAQIRISIDDVFTALFKNHVIGVRPLGEDGVSDWEAAVRSRFEAQKKEITDDLSISLNTPGDVGQNTGWNMKVFHDYILQKLEERKLLPANGRHWDPQTQTLHDFLLQEMADGNIAADQLAADSKYLTTAEAEALLEQDIINQLWHDREYDLLIYESMIENNFLSGTDILKLLYEQGVLPKTDPDYPLLLRGEMTDWEFVRKKIRNLELTPAQLALNPCSGSAVVTDPQNGQVLACVSYPGYDNNYLANQMDPNYYRTLSRDRSLPMFNRAIGQLTAPGSTFKPVTVAAGLNEGVIHQDTGLICDGVFDKVSPPLRCWNRAGHGLISSSNDALKNSCNDYLCDITYSYGSRGTGEFSEKEGLKLLQTYSGLFDLDKNTGIELGEAAPHVSDSYAIPSSIGQGTHNYTTSQIARYAGTLANHGTSYQLTLIRHISDWEGNIKSDFTPKVQSRVDLPETIWQNIELGMKDLAASNATLKNLKIQAAGKTGTAEESKKMPNHGWFIGYAPCGDPQIAMAVRIANGYSSGNVVGVGKNIFNYYFGLEDKEKIITGTAAQVSNNIRTD